MSQHLTDNMTAEEMTALLEDYKKRILGQYKLSRIIMAVALRGTGYNDWSAYIGIVTDWDDGAAWMLMKGEGTKLQQKVAEVLFPEVAEQYKWRA